jgi:hypothetical protein
MTWDEHYEEQVALQTPQQRAHYIIEMAYQFESRLGCLWRFPRGYVISEEESEMYEVLSEALATHSVMRDIYRIANSRNTNSAP